MEIWKNVEGYEGLYEISSKGVVRSLPKYNIKYERILKPDISGYYKRVVLFIGAKNDKGKRFYIHRLVAINFIENNKNAPQVNHIDGNKRNNNLENLEWVTASENIKKGWELGLFENVRKACVINGKKVALGKNYIEKPIYQLDKNNKLINEFKSVSQAGSTLKVNRSNIASVCRGERKTAGGYIFKFKK